MGVLFALYAGVTPLLHLGVVCVLWLVPLDPKPRLYAFTVSQMLSAWSSLDVTLVAVLGSVWGGRRFGINKFIEMIIYGANVGPSCTGLRDTFGVECISVNFVILQE